MTFLQPWAVWFLAGIPVIVLLYMLRLKQRERTVSTHLFWQRVLQESSRRALFHRLRHLWSLLLHLLIFLLIAGALARPLWNTPDHAAARAVLVLDTRARMRAVEADGETRFAKAKAIAASYARQANARSQFAIVIADRTSRVLVPFTDDPRALLDALEKLEATEAAGDVAEGVKLARAIVAGTAGEGRVVAITDRPLPEPAAKTPGVLTRTVGTSRDNVAITRFAARPHPASQQTVELLLEVQNFGSAPARAEVELRLDDRVFDVRRLDLRPGEPRIDVFSSVPRPGRNARGWLSAVLKTKDALAEDNLAYASYPARPPRRVLLVSSGNAFLEKLLAVDPGSNFQLIDPAAWQPALAPKFEVIIFDRHLPPAFKWEDAPANTLFVGATPFGSNAAPLERPLVTDIAGDDPLTRSVSLQNVTIQRATAQQLPPNAHGWAFRAPLRSFEYPLLIAGETGSRRIAALGFDVLESDLPLRVAFPLLIHNTLQWLDVRAVEAPLALEAGETFALRPAQSIAEHPLLGAPKNDHVPLTSTPVFQPLRNGFYLLVEGEERRWIAVNTFDAGESDLRQPDTRPTNDTISVTPALSGEWPLWTWLTFAALALFTGEWWLFHRRRTE